MRQQALAKGVDPLSIHVIGAGPGDERFLTHDAVCAMAQVDVLFASARYAHFAPKCVELHLIEALSDAMCEMDKFVKKGQNVGVLMSGDVSIYSLLPMLIERFGAKVVELHPGIGAIQALCTALKTTWQDAKVLSGHGRCLSASALAHAVRTHSRTILFCDREHGAAWASRAMIEEELASVRVAVGERLGYNDQRIRIGMPRDFLDVQFDPLAMLMIDNLQPARSLPQMGLPDNAFVRGNTPMTKREIRVQVLSTLKLNKDSVVWDIGAGTGSISIECARQCPLGEVYAIERDEEALELIKKNKKAFHLSNLHVVSGEAPNVLIDLPVPSHIFIGGSGGYIDEIFLVIRKMRVVRIVGTAVSIEGMNALLRHMGDMAGFEMMQLAVSRIEKLDSVHMLRAQNPVYIAAGTMEGDES